MAFIQLNISGENAKSDEDAQDNEVKPQKAKKKPQFSKVWLCISLGVSIFYTSLTYLFAWFGKETVSDVTIALNELLWGNNAVAFSGYAIQNCVRAFTASKYGIDTEKKEEKNNEEAKG